MQRIKRSVKFQATFPPQYQSCPRSLFEVQRTTTKLHHVPTRMTALLSSLNHARLEASEPRLANSNRAETIDLEAARHAITKNASGLAIDMTDGTNELAEKVSGQQYAFSPGSKSFPDGSILSPKPSPTTCDYQPPLMHTTAIPYDFPSPQTTPLQAKLPCFSTMQTSDGQTAYAEMPLKQPLQRRLAVRNIVIAAFGEFLGTFLFLFFAMAINTTVSAVKDAEKAAGDNSSDLTALLVSSLGFGFSLAYVSLPNPHALAVLH